MPPNLRLVLATIGVMLAFTHSAVCQELIAPVPASMPAKAGKDYTQPPQIPTPPSEVVLNEATAMQGMTGPYHLEELLNLASQNNPTLRQARAYFC